jgi:hypothetical protein
VTETTTSPTGSTLRDAIDCSAMTIWLATSVVSIASVRPRRVPALADVT